MTKPSPLAYLFGNAFSFGALSVGLVVFGCMYFSGAGGGFPAFLCLVGASYAYRANARLREYKLWKLEWDSMGDSAPRARAFALPQGRDFRLIAGIFAWLLLAAFSVVASDNPAMKGPVALFWIGSAILALAGGYRVLGSKRNAKPAPTTDRVQVCTPIPRTPPSLDQAYGALPRYCWPLFHS